MKLPDHNPIKRFILFILLAMLAAASLSSCASDQDITNKNAINIKHINITKNAMTSKSRPNMAGICKGFILSKNQITKFFKFSSHARETHSFHSYDILPCYAKGTALIENKSYNWIIRSGGVGEFYNKRHHFVKICGKGCCSKVAGVC